MSLRIGQKIQGLKFSYEIVKALKAPSVYQARIVDGPQTFPRVSKPATHVVIKTAESEKRFLYEREIYNYNADAIRLSPSIRRLMDYVNHDADDLLKEHETQCQVLEWMDSTLWDLRPSKIYHHGPLPRIVAKTLLYAVSAIGSENRVHTDINPNNILVNGAGTSSPEVKLADLGNAVAIAEREDGALPQGHAIRAPEVWGGAICGEKADVWSIGVSLAHWLADTTLFGPRGNRLPTLPEGVWCLARIIRLAGPLKPPAKEEHSELFEMATLAMNVYHTGDQTSLVPGGTIRQEMESLGVDSACVDFIEHLLVVDENLRPSAEEALQHPWLQSL